MLFISKKFSVCSFILTIMHSFFTNIITAAPIIPVAVTFGIILFRNQNSMLQCVRITKCCYILSNKLPARDFWAPHLILLSLCILFWSIILIYNLMDNSAILSKIGILYIVIRCEENTILSPQQINPAIKFIFFCDPNVNFI